MPLPYALLPIALGLVGAVAITVILVEVVPRVLEEHAAREERERRRRERVRPHEQSGLVVLADHRDKAAWTQATRTLDQDGLRHRKPGQQLQDEREISVAASRVSLRNPSLSPAPIHAGYDATTTIDKERGLIFGSRQMRRVELEPISSETRAHVLCNPSDYELSSPDLERRRNSLRDAAEPEPLMIGLRDLPDSTPGSSVPVISAPEMGNLESKPLDSHSDQVVLENSGPAVTDDAKTLFEPSPDPSKPAKGSPEDDDDDPFLSNTERLERIHPREVSDCERDQSTTSSTSSPVWVDHLDIEFDKHEHSISEWHLARSEAGAELRAEAGAGAGVGAQAGPDRDDTPTVAGSDDGWFRLSDDEDEDDEERHAGGIAHGFDQEKVESEWPSIGTSNKRDAGDPLGLGLRL
ncbi:uncharacterized protein JCM15063_005650 [Sporobolomyces koalae]|uniref:uncharacterized protein n=1 Tax=Sporobolomyces koalae TaxID=500713 RepID=UPI00318132A3